MRTPKRLYAEERIIYHPELLTCLHCGDLLVAWNSLAWDKTVQTLDGLLSIATRPSRCPHAMCPGSRIRLLSAAAQRLAPPGSTYGYDVLAKRYDPRLAHLYQGLQAALSPFAETSQTLYQGAAWLHDMAYIFEPVATYPSNAAEVTRPLRG